MDLIPIKYNGYSNPGFASLPQYLKEESHIMKWQENMATKILVILHMISCFAVPYSLLVLLHYVFSSPDTRKLRSTTTNTWS